MATPATIAANAMTYGFDSGTFLDRAEDWAREGIVDILRHVDVPYCFQLIEDTVTITGVLATDQAAARDVNPTVTGTIVRVENVYDLTNDEQLKVGTRGQVEARIANGEYGLPEFYAWIGETPGSGAAVLSVAPIPSGTVTIAFTGVIAPADDSATETTFCGTHERAVEAYTLYRCFQTQDDAEMASYWYGQYELARKGYDHQYNQSAKQTPRQVPGTWSETALP